MTKDAVLETRGRWLILAAALLWSSSGFFAKADVFVGWPGPLLAFWRAVFACLVLLPFVRRPSWSPWLVPMTMCFVGMNWSYLTAMTDGRAATAIWLQSTSPLWVLLASAIFLRERFGRADVWLVALGLAGVAIILFFELQGASGSSVFFGLLSGLLYAGVVLSLRYLRSSDSAWLVAFNLMVTAVVLSPYAFLSDISPAGGQWLYLVGFGMLQMGVPYLLFARGVRYISGHEASGIVLAEPVLVPVWAYVVWDEAITWPIVVGGALIFSGLALRFTAFKPARVLRHPPGV